MGGGWVGGGIEARTDISGVCSAALTGEGEGSGLHVIPAPTRVVCTHQSLSR